MADAPRIEDISTRWPLLGDPVHVVMRYAPAIRAYLGVLVRDADDADEVCQDLLARVLATGFSGVTPERGRFRMYLKACVRNAAWMSLRARSRALAGAARLEAAAEPAEVHDAWAAAWRVCVVERAVERVRRQGGAADRVLQLVVTHEGEDSAHLAERLTAVTGQPVRADAVRKQLSRARRAVASAIVDEVAATLVSPTADAVEAELRETGLWDRVASYLDPTWRDGLAAG